MGTNFYVEEQPPCPHCGRGYEQTHVGKASAGWKFSFNAIERRTLDEWSEFLRKNDGRIKNEYGESISCDAFLSMVHNRRDLHSEPSEIEYVRDGCIFITREFS